MLKRFMFVIAGVALAASACSSGISISGSAQTPEPTGIPTPDNSPEGVAPVAMALRQFDECAAFLAYVKGEALERVTPWGLEGNYPIGVPFMEDEIAMEAAEESADTAGPAPVGGDDGAAGSPVEGQDFSGTNVQVAGVDEPDIVKTDGTRIVRLADGVLKVTDVSGTQAVPAGSLSFDDIWPQELLLAGDTVIVFGSSDNQVMPVEPFEGDFESWTPTTAIVRIDISGDPEIESVLTIEGNYLNTRETDGVARVAISSPPLSLPFLYPSTPAGEEAALEANKQIIRDSDLSHWMPDYVLETADGDTAEGQLVDCSRIHGPAEFSGFDILSVLTLDLAGRLTPGEATAVVASGETVYASGENFYIATTRWPEPMPFEITDNFPPEFEESYTTDVHMFSMTGSAPADYLASGAVRGHALNQFAFHEWDETLFVTTTDGSPWGFTDESESYLTALEQDRRELVKIGQVGDMGQGERVFSVRYIADQAYVVTFREVDPLYVVDLRDPTNPTVTGELKIPGFSSYLHPVGDGLLLGVGQDATEEGFTTGAKVSLFDVTDPADPRQVSTWTMPGGYSDVEWDHRAFLYWAPEQMAVLPLQSWEQGFSGAVVLQVDDDALNERGRIDHSERGLEYGATDCDELDVSDPEIRESFPEILVLACDPDDEGGAVGYFCDVYSADEAAELAEEYSVETGNELDLEADQRLEVCWPDGDNLADPILRSLVIGDDVWTMSHTMLQANDMLSLDRTQRVR